MSGTIMKVKLGKYKRASAVEVRTEAANLLLKVLQYREDKLKAKTLEVANKIIDETCSLLLAKHSEANGKHIGCQFMSEKAINIYKSYFENIGEDLPFKKRVIHEHLYPKHQTIKDLYELIDPNYEAIKAILEERNIGVLITKDENRNLDALGLRLKCNKTDIWERYRDAKIVTCNVFWENDLITSHEIVSLSKTKQ